MDTLKDKISSPNWHPEIDLLLSFAEDSLDKETYRLLHSHIDACDICQSTILGIEAERIQQPDKETFTSNLDLRADMAYQKFTKEKSASTYNIPKRKSRLLPFISISSLAAASILLFFFFRGFQFAYYPADIPFVNFTSITKGSAPHYDKGLIKYHEKQFEIAQTLFLRADTIFAKYYLGVIELKNGEEENGKAEDYFNIIYQNTTGDWHYRAIFYLLQIKYQQKDYAACRVLMEEFKTQADFYPEGKIQAIENSLRNKGF